MHARETDLATLLSEIVGEYHPARLAATSASAAARPDVVSPSCASAVPELGPYARAPRRRQRRANLAALVYCCARRRD
ncbi:MAG: hypothetical protein U0Z44_14030 [Kouleothrix sp.]